MTKTKWYSRPIVIASEAWQSRRMVRLKAWKSVSILVALALVLSLAITAVPMAGTVEGNPGTIQVDVNDAGCVTGTGQPDPYACVYCNIQDAIDDAFAGDAINVAAGTYNEVVKIGKPLTLLGAQAGVDPRPSVGGRTGDEATIDGGGNSCVTISADNIIINGFTMLNAGGKNGGNGCVWIEPSRQHISVLYNSLSDARYGVWTDSHCQHIVIENNNIRDCGRGVYARDCTDDEVAPVVRENDFYDNWRGIFMYHIYHGKSYALIYDNRFEELTEGTTDYGIYTYLSGMHIKGNTFINVGAFYPDGYTYPSAIAGLGSTSTSDWGDVKRCVIEDNVIIATKTVAIMGYFCDFLVRNNEITRLSSGYAAIWIKGGTGYDPSQEAYAGWTIENNKITGPGNSGNGIYGTGGGYGQSALSASGNTITGFANGVRLVNDGDIVAKATIQFNNILGNQVFGITNVGANAEVDATFNWWGDASGPEDTSGDTDCKTPSEEGWNCDTCDKNDGTGNAVTDNVDYCPWLTAPYRPTTPMASFVIDHAKIDFKKKPDDDKVRVKGKLELGNGVDILEDDVIVTVGPLSQTITMVVKGKNDEKWQYKRPKHDGGDIKHMTIDWKKGKFDIRMDKADLSELTDPDHVTISIQIGDDVGEETITMRVKKHHWDYKAK